MFRTRLLPPDMLARRNRVERRFVARRREPAPRRLMVYITRHRTGWTAEEPAPLHTHGRNAMHATATF